MQNFQYSTDPDGLYQGDAFTLNGNGVEIQIVKLVRGNYGIRKVKGEHRHPTSELTVRSSIPPPNLAPPRSSRPVPNPRRPKPLIRPSRHGVLFSSRTMPPIGTPG